MNKLFIAATLAALVSSPALAKNAHVHHQRAHSHASQNYVGQNYLDQGYVWSHQPVRGAQARYFAIDPAANPEFDRQLGNDYEQRP